MTILCIEDDPLQKRYMSQILIDLEDVIFANSGEEALAIADASDNINLIIADIILGRMTGIEFIKKIRQNNNMAGVPIIAYSGYMNTELAEMALNAGATVTLDKSIDIRILNAQVQSLLKNSNCGPRIRPLPTKQITNNLDKSPIYDSLKNTLSDANRLDYNIGLIFVDIDHFKEINSAYGHIEGDKIIKQFSDFLSHTFNRSNDRIMRFGGDEFIITTPIKNRREAEKTLNHLFETSLKCTVIKGSDTVKISISFTASLTLISSSLETINDEFISRLLDKTSKDLISLKERSRGSYSITENANEHN